MQLDKTLYSNPWICGTGLVALMQICVCSLSAALEDYRGVTENISISSSVSEACVVVEIEDDSAVESTEYLTVSLSLLLAGQALELDPSSTTIYIIDNDG